MTDLKEEELFSSSSFYKQDMTMNRIITMDMSLRMVGSKPLTESDRERLIKSFDELVEISKKCNVIFMTSQKSNIQKEK
jgi:hypothetical protein